MNYKNTITVIASVAKQSLAIMRLLRSFLPRNDRKIIFTCVFALFFFSSLKVFSQGEVLMEGAYSFHPGLSNVSHQSRNVSASLTLPFFDDFSQRDFIPNTNRWEDNSVYITDNLPVNPLTVGTAVFNGLKSDGTPYNLSATQDGYADALTSQAIDLSGVTASDSLVFSFFFQPQGIGNPPIRKDSLVLDFLAVDTAGATYWKWVWSDTGSVVQPFRFKAITVTDTVYFHNAFQFRFRNIATLTGDFDHWLIDIVHLDTGRSVFDSTYADRAIRMLPTLPISAYSYIPMRQFKTMNYLKSFDLTINNLDSAAYSGTCFAQVKDTYSGIVLANYFKNYSLSPYGDTTITFSSFNASFVDATQPTNLQTFYEINFGSPTDFSRQNDTLTTAVEIGNTLAYDDGSAENGYGIATVPGKFAQKFNFATTDTIDEIQIAFSYQGADNSSRFFTLVIWKDIFTDDILYKNSSVKPAYGTTENYFQSYKLKAKDNTTDTMIVVNGDFYVGIIQSDGTVLGVGVDKNTDNLSEIFYNVGTGWTATSFTGTLMIRVKTFNTQFVGIKEPFTIHHSPFTIYPNPFSEMTTIRIMNTEQGMKNYELKIYDLFGREIKAAVIRNSDAFVIRMDNFTAGMYLVEIYERKNGTVKRVGTEKLVKY